MDSCAALARPALRRPLVDEWRMIGPYRDGAYSIQGPECEFILVEIKGEPRECPRTRYIAEKILQFCKEQTKGAYAPQV